MKRNILNFLCKLNSIINYLIENLRLMETVEMGYYVYIPQMNKPKYIHSNYKSAKQEADRLYKMFEDKNQSVDIQILQIIKTEEVFGIPF